MKPAKKLVFHGLIIFFLGLGSGFFFGAAIVEQWGERTIAAWKLAHLEGVLNGLLVMVIGAVYHLVNPSPGREPWIRRLLIYGGYCNVIGAIAAATLGQRGLEPTGPWSNWLVFAIFTSGVVALLIGLGTLFHALMRTDEAEP